MTVAVVPSTADRCCVLSATIFQPRSSYLFLGYLWRAPLDDADLETYSYGSVYEWSYRNSAILETLITTRELFRATGYCIFSFHHWRPNDVRQHLFINETSQTEDVVSYFRIARSFLYVRTPSSNSWKSKDDIWKTHALRKLNASDTLRILEEDFSLDLLRLSAASVIFYDGFNSSLSLPKAKHGVSKPSDLPSQRDMSKTNKPK